LAGSTGTGEETRFGDPSAWAGGTIGCAATTGEVWVARTTSSTGALAEALEGDTIVLLVSVSGLSTLGVSLSTAGTGVIGK
jgi:hypothetical protein